MFVDTWLTRISFWYWMLKCLITSTICLLRMPVYNIPKFCVLQCVVVQVFAKNTPGNDTILQKISNDSNKNNWKRLSPLPQKDYSNKKRKQSKLTHVSMTATVKLSTANMAIKQIHASNFPFSVSSSSVMVSFSVSMFEIACGPTKINVTSTTLQTLFHLECWESSLYSIQTSRLIALPAHHLTILQRWCSADVRARRSSRMARVIVNG